MGWASFIPNPVKNPPSVVFECARQELRIAPADLSISTGLSTCSSILSRLQVTWQGEGDQQLRCCLCPGERSACGTGTLAVRKGAAGWRVLARNLSPEFDVVSGRRRLSEQQAGPLRVLGISMTPDVVEREKWNAFADTNRVRPA